MAHRSEVDLHSMTASLGAEDWIEVGDDFVSAAGEGSLLDRFDIRLTHAGRGRARGLMVVQAVHLNQRGVAQAGSIVAFADAVAGWATYCSVDSRFATLGLSTSLIRGASAGDRLVAEARVVHPGRTTQVVEVIIEKRDPDGTGKQVARFSCTQMVIGER